MNIFITGGTGGLGHRLIPRLTGSGHNLTLLSRGTIRAFTSEQVVQVTGDLLEQSAYAEYLEGVDIIVHMAAVTRTNNQETYYQVNTEGTILLLRLAEAYQVPRFLYLSSSALSMDGGAYCRSKKLAEDAVRQSDRDWVILRPSEIYGLVQSEAITKLIRTIERYPIVFVAGDGKYTFAPVHADDVIAAIEKVLAKPECKHKIFNLSGPEQMSCLELIKKIEDLRQVKRLVVHIPLFLLKVLAGMMAMVRLKNVPLVVDRIPRLLCEKSSDISLAAQELDYKPAPLHQRL